MEEQIVKEAKKWYEKTWGIIAALIIFFPLGLFVMWKYARWGKKVKWGVTGLLALLLVFGMGNDSSKKTEVASQTSTATASQNLANTSNTAPTALPTEIPSPKPTLTPQQIIANFSKDAQKVTVSNIYKSPNSYQGKSLIFTCSVSGFPKDNNGDVAGLNCSDPNDFLSNVQIAIGKNTDVTKINQNDSIKVYGLGLGAITGKNGFGADITTGGVMGLYINDLTTGYTDY